MTLALHLQAEVIEVKGNAVPRATSGRQTINGAEIEELPSIDRDPRDMVRRTLEVTVEWVLRSAHVMSVGVHGDPQLAEDIVFQGADVSRLGDWTQPATAADVRCSWRNVIGNPT